MNIFSDPSLWRDLNMDSPPIWWNEAAGQYEILIDEAGSPNGSFAIISLNAASQGDTLTFTFNLTGFDPDVGGEGFLNVLEDNTPVFSQSLNEGLPITGTVDLVCEEGRFYKVMVTSSASGYDYSNFYDFMGTLTPTATPSPAIAPWWLCAPKEPLPPCPVRPTGFVPFDQYDADFKYPLASSRVPSKVVLAEDCISCSPGSVTDIAPTPPDPEPPDTITMNFICTTSELSNTAPGVDGSGFQDLPSWFDEEAVAIVSGEGFGYWAIWDAGLSSWVLSNETGTPEDVNYNGDITVTQGSNTANAVYFFNCA